MRVIYLAFVALGVLWGSNFMYMKWASLYVTPGQIALLRVFFGFLPLAFVAWRRGVIEFGQLRYIAHFSVMAVAATAFYYYAIAMGTMLIPSGVAGVLGGSIALFTTITASLFLRDERINSSTTAGILLGFGGIVLIARPWEGLDRTIDVAGVFWMLAATMTLGGSYVYVRRFLSPLNLPPLALATWQIGLALIVLSLTVDYHGLAQIMQNRRALTGVVVGLGFLGTGVVFLIYYYLLEKLGAVAASGATYLTPVVAMTIGWFGGETVDSLELGAVVLILSSIGMLQVGRQSR